MKIENRVALLESQNALVQHDNVSLQITLQRSGERQQIYASFLAVLDRVQADEGFKIDPNTLKEVNSAGNKAAGS